MKKIVYFVLFSAMPALAQPNINQVEYFADTDPGFGNGTSVVFAPQQDVSVLFPLLLNQEPGVHLIGLRAKDADGMWSHTNFIPVYVEDNTVGLIDRMEYFWDTDPGFGNAIPFPLSEPVADFNSGSLIGFDVPVDLSVGTHKLFVRSHDVRGRWSHTNYAWKDESGNALNAINITLLGLEELESQAGIMVYPNPFVDSMTIATKTATPKTVFCYDMTGKLVFKLAMSAEETVNTENLASGAYTLLIWSDAQTIYKTTVIKK